VCQNGPDIDVSLGNPAILYSRKVNDGHQAVAVLAEVEDHVSLHGIGILKGLLDFHEAPPPRGLRDLAPSRDFFRRIRVVLGGSAQGL
jgi:hypothetical protein